MSYKVVYAIEPRPDGVETDDVPEGWGAADAVIIQSLIFPEDGSFSFATFSTDGRTGKPVEDVDVFRAWFMTANQLMESPELAPWQRHVASEAFRAVQQIILARRGITDEPERRDAVDEGRLAN